MADLVFNPTVHEYRLDGVVLPSVTTILKAEGFINTTHYTDSGRDRGTVVHEACHLFNVGQLDETTLDADIIPYVEAYKTFLTDTDFYVVESELRIHNATYGYAGTLDIIGYYPQGKRPYVVDIKTGTMMPWTALQLEAYALCLEEPHGRTGLQLSAEGKYKATEFTDRKDLQAWLAALTTYKWKQNNLK